MHTEFILLTKAISLIYSLFQLFEMCYVLLQSPSLFCVILLFKVFTLADTWHSFKQSSNDVLHNETEIVLDVETLINEVEDGIVATIKNRRWARQPSSNNNNCFQRLQMGENRKKHLKIEENSLNDPIELKLQLQNCKLKPKHSFEKSHHQIFRDSSSQVTHFHRSSHHDANTHYSQHHAQQISDSSSEEMHFYRTHFNPKHVLNNYGTSSSSFETFIKPPHFRPSQIQPPYYHHHNHDHHKENKKHCSKAHHSTSSETSKESLKTLDKKIMHCKGVTDKLLNDFKIKMDNYDKVINLYKTKYEEIFIAYSNLKVAHENNVLIKNDFEKESKNLSISLLTCNLDKINCNKEKMDLNKTIEDLKQIILSWSAGILKYRNKLRDYIKTINSIKNKLKILESKLKTCNADEIELMEKIKKLTDQVTDLNIEKLNYAKLLLECHNSCLECQKNVAKLTDDLLKCKKESETNSDPIDTDPLLNEDQLDREFELDFRVSSPALIPSGSNLGSLAVAGSVPPGVSLVSGGGTAATSGTGGTGTSSVAISTGTSSGAGFSFSDYCKNKTIGLTLHTVFYSKSKSVYYISPKDMKVSFMQAKSACLSRNMYLACTDNYEEYLALQQLMQRLPELTEGFEYWLGHYNSGTQNSYVCDADSLTPVYAYVQQQNDINNPCVSLTFHQVFSSQHNQDCNLLKGFICELRESCASIY